MVNIDKVAYKEVNFKSKLIEWSQKNRVKIDFKLVSEEKDQKGNSKFIYQVAIEGLDGEKGEGYSKKESQQMASKLTLQRLRKEPQFIDAVFAAKASRTKMEEMPTTAVPETKEEVPFPSEEGRKGQEVERLERFDGSDEVVPVEKEQEEKSQKQTKVSADEFDLSDISAAAQSREDIIAAAEAAAFAEL
jgi:ribonuclease-3